METSQEPVKEMGQVRLECGVDQHQLAMVSTFVRSLIDYAVLFLTAYTCISLTLIPNGMITYDPDRTPPFIFGTTATYSCNQGFYPSHTSVRTCTGSGATSFWDGTAPNCLG